MKKIFHWKLSFIAVILFYFTREFFFFFLLLFSLHVFLHWNCSNVILNWVLGTHSSLSMNNNIEILILFGYKMNKFFSMNHNVVYHEKFSLHHQYLDRLDIHSFSAHTSTFATGDNRKNKIVFFFFLCDFVLFFLWRYNLKDYFSTWYKTYKNDNKNEEKKSLQMQRCFCVCINILFCWHSLLLSLNIFYVYLFTKAINVNLSVCSVRLFCWMQVNKCISSLEYCMAYLVSLDFFFVLFYVWGIFTFLANACTWRRTMMFSP